MSGRQLSPDVVSLIHHVHLNENGWWRKAVGQIVSALFWAQSRPITMAEAADEFRRLVGINLPEHDLRKHVDALVQQGALGNGSSGFYLRVHSRKEMDAAHAAATREQDECRATFIEICEQRCAGLDSAEIWEAFTKALSHAVRTSGANLFHLLAGDRLLREVDWPRLLLSKFPPEQRESVRTLLAEFLGDNNSSCRNVILRHLSAHFFAEAAQLKPETIQALEAGRRRRQLKVVLDTNFIFSVLELHDNPGDDSALSLLQLAQTAGPHLDVRLYVLPGTLDEAQRTLIYQHRLVQRVRARPNVAHAALSSPLPSIARKYFATASKVGGLSADAYFDPYISDLRTILRGKGIHILDAQALINQRQDVVDDTLAEQERENSEVPEPRRKGYEKILHDVVLWHAVNDRRIEHATDPFDVEYWGVTVDWSLIGFDRRKRREGASRLPVLLHPSNLLQLLQFWVPRTEALEDGLVNSLRLPLLFQSFDPADEKATINVLEAISRFENVDDIPESTLRVVLANQALRARLKEASASNDEIFELVREEMLAEHRDAVARLEQANSTLGETKSLLEHREGALREAEQRLRETQVRQSDAESAALAARGELTESQEELKQRKAREDLLSTQLARQTRSNFLLLFLILPILAGGLLGASGYILLAERLPDPGRGLIAVAAFLAPMAGAFCMVPIHLRRRPELGNWNVAHGVAWIGKKFVLLPLGLVLVGILQGAAWEWVKRLMQS